MMAHKPRVFIGSSVEGLAIAEHIQLGLDYHAECTLWSQGVFGLSGGTLESLLKAVRDYTFAVLVLTPDDLVQKRSVPKNSPRDNVLFELGLFMGALGRERTYIVYCRDTAIELPTDLAGVTAATFARRADGNLQASLGAVCTKLKTTMAAQTALLEPLASNGSLVALQEEISALKIAFAAQTAKFATHRNDINRMLESILSGPGSGTSRNAIRGDAAALDFLVGSWQAPDLGSMYYVRRDDGELTCVYCRGGNHQLTGEYYDWRLVERTLLARFRWLDDPSHDRRARNARAERQIVTPEVEGYAFLHIASNDLLAGGWLLKEDIPEVYLDDIPRVPGAVHFTWIRQANAAAIPDWAEIAFARVCRDRQDRDRRASAD